MRKLLIIMTAVFGLCFSIIGNAKDKLTWEENRNIVLKGEVISSFAYKTGEINNLITRSHVLLIRYKGSVYDCETAIIPGPAELFWSCIPEYKE